MCESGEEVEYQLVCRRTGEVVGMAYIRPQEEANLHNLLLGPEEEVINREHEIEDKKKTVADSELTNDAGEGSYDGMRDRASECKEGVNITAAQMVEVKVKDESGEDEIADSKMMKKEAGSVGQEVVKGPNFGLRQGKGDLGKPGLFGWQREVVYDEHTRCGIALLQGVP